MTTLIYSPQIAQAATLLHSSTDIAQVANLTQHHQTLEE